MYLVLECIGMISYEIWEFDVVVLQGWGDVGIVVGY